MSVLQEANVLLLCQSTSRAGAVGGEVEGNSGWDYSSHATGKRVGSVSWDQWCRCSGTWMKGELLFGFSCMSVPYDCCLGGYTHTQAQLELAMSAQWWKAVIPCVDIWADLNNSSLFTLSTPALRIKLPFLFHLRAKMGPLCWPSVLARLPVESNTDCKWLETTTTKCKQGSKQHKMCQLLC